MTVSVFAPAKINLTLHVTGQRNDGYHLLDSLVAFGAVGDRLIIEDADELSLKTAGPEWAEVPTGPDNLVIRAARLLDGYAGAALTLEKYLPTASGLGGGSSDAAATLRGLLTYWKDNLPESAGHEAVWSLAEEALSLGADIPMCLNPSPVRVQGIGEKITPVSGIPDLPMVLVNPRLSVSTPQVFSKLRKKDNPSMQETFPQWRNVSEFCLWLVDQRNDLQLPAISVCPKIEKVLDVLMASQNVLVARMSGSGATCFAIYPDLKTARSVHAKLAVEHPNWWLSSGMAGDQSEVSKPRIS